MLIRSFPLMLVTLKAHESLRSLGIRFTRDMVGAAEVRVNRSLAHRLLSSRL